MNHWQETLKQFIALGGIAKNITFANGEYGRGLFPIDSKQAVKLQIPNRMQLPIDWLQLNKNNELILTKECDWSEAAKSFYLEYLHNYGLNNEVVQYMMDKQEQMFMLPDNLKSMLLGFGMPELLFKKPSMQVCLDIYKVSRRVVLNDKVILMPLVELVNHNGRTNKTFDKPPNLGVSGKFKGEVLVNYGMSGDAVTMFTTYGFSEIKPNSFSGALSIKLGQRAISISRLISIHDTFGSTKLPKIKLEGNDVHLSFLVVGSSSDISSPKKIFTKLMHSVGMPPHIASNVFDGLVDQNRSFFLRLLEELKPLEGDMVEGLRNMVKHQLIPLGARV